MAVCSGRLEGDRPQVRPAGEKLHTAAQGSREAGAQGRRLSDRDADAMEQLTVRTTQLKQQTLYLLQVLLRV